MGKVLFIMGVSGCGKSSVGLLLAEALSIPFIEADDYHSTQNIEKMSQGLPLDDDDRWPWLQQLNQKARENSDTGCVIACSALKESYRKELARSIESKVSWIYLKGTFELIFDRMRSRKGHFMKQEMLESQFQTLEEPGNALVVDIQNSPAQIVERIESHFTMEAEIGVIGMGVMGKSLSRNLARNGFGISIYNRYVKGLEENVAADFKASHAELNEAQAFDELGAFVSSLASPRKIILMVNAGAAVDSVLDELAVHLEQGDVVIDGGNSHFKETNARIGKMAERGVSFIGAGISGGESGALNGPSIMPSGDREAYGKVQKYLEAISAKDATGDPCCTYIGSQGSGHFVKMVHNGIEYVEMQLLAECYTLLKQRGDSNEEIAASLESWRAELDSYLLEITVDIVRKKEGDDYLLDKILDKAGNKGTGSWATSTIAEYGLPATLIPAALFARYLSFFKEAREQAAQVFPSESSPAELSTKALKEAYQFSRIVNHHQGFLVISMASKKQNWNVDLAEVARIWTEGCIIKSDLMKELSTALKGGGLVLEIENLQRILQKIYPSIQSIAIACLRHGVYAPVILESVNYFHGLKTANSSANLIQAQRDYFGAHTYQRVDDPTGKSYHTDWEG